MKTRILAFVTAVGLLGYGCRQGITSVSSTSQSAAHPAVAPPCVVTNDAEINAAMQQARRTFTDFWSEVSADSQRPAPTLQQAMVKAHFSDGVSPTNEEMMWVGNVEFDGAKISGILANEPLHVRSLQRGQRVSFPLDQLGDWFFVRDGKLVGGFTERILRSRLSDEDRRIYDSQHPYALQ